MGIRALVLGTTFALIGLWCGIPPAAAATAGHPGFSTERLWGPHNDWEPNIAADPSSPWLYQMTTQYGGHRVCRPRMNHCILFRSSPDRGRTWGQAMVMPRTRSRASSRRRSRISAASVLMMPRTATTMATANRAYVIKNV